MSVALLRQRKQRTLVPCFCLCLAVPLCHWGSELAPSLRLSSSFSGIAADSRLVWWEPQESTGPADIPWEQQPCFWARAGQNGCWGSRGWEWRGGRHSWVLSAPSSARGGVREAGWAAWPLFKCPVTEKTVVAEEMEETVKYQGEGKAEPGGAEPAVALRPGRARWSRFCFPRAGGHTTRAPRLLAWLVATVGPLQTAVSLSAWPHSAGEAVAGSSRPPCLPHRVLWTKRELGNLL